MTKQVIMTWAPKKPLPMHIKTKAGSVRVVAPLHLSIDELRWGLFESLGIEPCKCMQLLSKGKPVRYGTVGAHDLEGQTLELRANVFGVPCKCRG